MEIEEVMIIPHVNVKNTSKFRFDYSRIEKTWKDIVLGLTRKIYFINLLWKPKPQKSTFISKVYLKSTLNSKVYFGFAKLPTERKILSLAEAESSQIH